jgi:hypothetical protein
LNKSAVLIILILATITLTAFNMFDSKREVPIELIAFDSLTIEEKQLIPASPKDSIVKKVAVNEEIKSKIDVKYDKEEVYSVTFRHTQTETSGNLEVYVALDKKTVVGKSTK